MCIYIYIYVYCQPNFSIIKYVIQLIVLLLIKTIVAKIRYIYTFVMIYVFIPIVK